MTKQHLLGLDLDYTVRYPKESKFPGLNNQIIYPEALDIIREYSNVGYIVGMSNQGGIEKGYKSLEECKQEIEEFSLLTESLFDSIMFCPNYSGKGHELYYYQPKEGKWGYLTVDEKHLNLPNSHGFRKPEPRMMILALLLFKVENRRSLFVGDLDTDREMASRANVPYIDAVRWRNLANI